MKVLLIVPMFEDIYSSYRHLYRRGFLNPPMSFSYIASALENAGHVVRIIDGEAEALSIKNIIDIAREYNADIFGLTATSVDFNKVKGLALNLKRCFPDIPVVIGGPHINIFEKNVLEKNPEIDFGCIGDGEDLIVELVSAFTSKAENRFDSIKGLVFRKQKNIIQNPYRPVEPNIDKYAFPARNLLNNRLYRRLIPNKGYSVTASFMSSRGCPYSCIYCAVKSMNNQEVRLHSADRVVNELDYIVNKLKIKHIAFNDDCLTLDKKRIYKICSGIRKTNLKFTWEGLSRADLVDKDLLNEMKASGFIRISYGIESGNSEILKIMQKNEILEQIVNAIKITHSAGIITRGSAIIGLPYETEKSARETLRFIRSLKELDEVMINILQPYPGTHVRDMIMRGEGGTRFASGKTDFECLKRLGSALIYVNDLTPHKLVFLQWVGFISFYIRPRNIIRRIHLYGFKTLLNDLFLFLNSLFFK